MTKQRKEYQLKKLAQHITDCAPLLAYSRPGGIRRMNLSDEEKELLPCLKAEHFDDRVFMTKEEYMVFTNKKL
jgi:hypothetical protein